MARVLVTGANGFVGAEIVRQLVAAGHEAVALVLPGTSRSRLGRLEVEFREGDVRQQSSVEHAMRDVSCCIHLAGDTSFYRFDRPRLEAVNVEGTRHVVTAARAAGVKRLVHTSSVAAIGFEPSGAPADEDTRFNWPAGLPYMETKQAGERLALAAADDDFQVVSLNPATILGSGPHNPSKSGLVGALRAGRIFVLPRGGTTICDLEDVARAHVAALGRGRSGERFILGGPDVAFRELIPALAGALGTSAPRRLAPRRLLPALGQALALPEAWGLDLGTPAGALRLSELDLYYSSAKATAELGYRSRPMAEIVERTVTNR